MEPKSHVICHRFMQCTIINFQPREYNDRKVHLRNMPSVIKNIYSEKPDINKSWNHLFTTA